MNDLPQHLLLYSANFAFILTNLYGWILIAFYRAVPYRDNYNNLFPAQKANAAIYLVQLFEIPYLLMLPDLNALFYVNAFSILLFSALMGVMMDGYFFFRERDRWQSVCYFLPVVLIPFYLLLAALEVVPPATSRFGAVWWITTAVFLCYVGRLIVLKRNIGRSIRAVDEGTYSNTDDFPVRFARRIEWVPITICALMFVCFVANDVWVKMWRDLFFTGVNVWFLLYTLNPHRNGVIREEKPDGEAGQISIEAPHVPTKYKLSAERCKEIEARLIELIETEKPFLDCHLTLDQLSFRLSVNRSYVSETLSRSTHGSFYSLINFYRLEHAQELLQHNPSLKLEHVALDSGFSSINVFSQVFKRYRQITPGAFVKALQRENYTQTK